QSSRASDHNDKQAHQFLKAEYAVARALAESSSQDEAIHRVLQALCESLEWQLGEFWVVDSEANVLRFLDIWHKPDITPVDLDNRSREMPFARGVGLRGRIWESGEAAWIRDTRQDENFPRIVAATKDSLLSATGLPVMLGQQVFGVLELF